MLPEDDARRNFSSNLDNEKTGLDPDQAHGEDSGGGEEGPKVPTSSPHGGEADTLPLPDTLFQVLSWSEDAWYDVETHAIGDSTILAVWRHPDSNVVALAAFYDDETGALIARVHLI